MSRLKWLVFVVVLTPLMGGCTGTATVNYQDMQLRDWAYRMDDWADEVADWQIERVWPALKSLCELERWVYDTKHTDLNPTERICPPGQSDPPSPPDDPEDWD